MRSLYDELSGKAAAEGATGRGGARADLGMLLYGRRAEMRELWAAAVAHLETGDGATRARLEAAVTALAPLFGER